MTITHWSENLVKLGACDPACEFAATQETPEQAWNNCPKPDWLLWLASELEVDKKPIILSACALARIVVNKYVPKNELRSGKALDVTEAWCHGKASDQELTEARNDAWAAESKLWSKRYAAEAAASDAAAGGFVASTGVHVAATHDAARAAVTSETLGSNRPRAEVEKEFADIVRKMIPMPEIVKTWK